METVAFCEIEEYPQKVLAKHWPNVPIYNDVRELTGERLRADGITGIDVICGGFPCQDISVAGNQSGIGEGTRSGLWSECARLLGDIRPRYAIFENVTALLSGDSGRWFEQVLWDISKVGYDAEWHCIPASELGAHHHRDRVWIIAYPQSLQCNGSDIHREHVERQADRLKSGGSDSQNALPDTHNQGLQRGKEPGSPILSRERWQELIARRFCSFGEISEVEPTIRGGANGVPNHAHRLKAVGNAVVPQIPELIGRAIMAEEEYRQCAAVLVEMNVGIDK